MASSVVYYRRGRVKPPVGDLGMIDSLALTPRAGTRVRRCGDARNQDSGVTTATGERSRHVTGAPPQAHPGPAARAAARRATAREGRRPVGGGRPRDADGQCLQAESHESTGALIIAVHRASERGGAPNPRLLVLRSVLDVAVRPQGSSSSSSPPNSSAHNWRCEQLRVSRSA